MTSKWNKNFEKIIEDIGNKSLILKEKHTKNSKISSNKHGIFMTLIMIANPLSGTLSTVAAVLLFYQFEISAALTILSSIL